MLASLGNEIEEHVAEEGLIVDVERQLDTWWHQVHPRGTLLKPLGGKERRERRGNAIDHRPGLVGGMLVALQPLPLGQQVVLDRTIGEHVRMAADQLGDDPALDVGKIECARLASDLGVDDDLEEKIAELIGQSVVVTGIKSLERLVGLFQEVRPE